MVKPILLAKMLHCQSVRENSSRIAKTKQKGFLKEPDNTLFLKEVKIEQYDYDMLQNICRVCLKEGNIPIFSDVNDLDDSLRTFAGIDVQKDDLFPKYLCVICNALVEGAILLRKTALKSNEVLKNHGQNLAPTSGFKSTIKEPAIKSEDSQNLTKPFTAGDVMSENSIEYSEGTYEEENVKKTENFFCKRCKLEFETKEELQDHKISDEHKNKRFTCNVCGKSLSAKYYDRHMSLHDSTPSHVCDVCGKPFVIQGHFIRHRMTHFYALPFKCNLCPYRGRFRESLKMHMRSHTGERPYPCTECPHRFVNKSNLNKHMLTHKSEHDYKCNSCGRGFYTKRDLEQHFKVDHTGLKEHICNTCGKAFGYRKQMMKHQLKVHKREKLRSGRLPLYLVVESKKQKGEEVI